MNNLHRHQNCALMQDEVTADALSEERSQPIVFARSHSNASDGTELEDEFGSNLFEEAGLSEGHPDEVVLGSATVTRASADVSEMRSNNGAPHSVLRHQLRVSMQSLPALEPTNGRQPP